MSEVEFIDAIDASFRPLSDRERESAIEIALSISNNSVLMVVYELVTETGDAERGRRELETISRRTDSAVVQASVRVARPIIEGGHADARDVAALLAEAERSPGSFNALAIAQSADPSLAERCSGIADHWKAGG